MGFTDYRLDWTKERAAEFNEMLPQYNVIIEGYQSYNAAFDATVLAAEQGNPPANTHFFEAATQNARDAVNPDGAPLFKSVAEAIGDMTEINGVPVVLDDVVSAAADYYTVDGVFTSMPWNTSTTVMFSNATMLEQAGIAEIPETWGGIVEACETILAMDEMVRPTASPGPIMAGSSSNRWPSRAQTWLTMAMAAMPVPPRFSSTARLPLITFPGGKT